MSQTLSIFQSSSVYDFAPTFNEVVIINSCVMCGVYQFIGSVWTCSLLASSIGYSHVLTDKSYV